jgi:hypothetical protein
MRFSMKARKIGLALFWLGVGYMFMAGWLIRWWVTPVWRHSPNPFVQFKGTIWTFEGPIFMFIAFSVPLGIVLVSTGMLLYGRSERSRLWPFIIGFIVIALSILFPSTFRYYSSVSGILEGMIYLFFFAALWLWAKNRKTLTGKAGTAADLQLISYVFFLFTASLACSLLGNPYSGLNSPEKVLQYESPLAYYCMGMKMVLLFCTGLVLYLPESSYSLGSLSRRQNQIEAA